MIKKLTKNELSDLLISRDTTKYLYELNVLHNTGNPNLAVTEMYGYSIGNDIVIVNVYCFDGYSVYFEVSDFNNLKYIHDEIENDMKKYKEILLISDSEQLFQNPVFIRLFGKHDFIESEMYGMLNLSAYLDNIELVVVGVESDKNARPLYYDWVLQIRQQCISQNVHFEFRQCGTNTRETI